MQELDLSNNPITSEAGKLLVRLAQANLRIVDINVDATIIRNAVRKQLHAQLECNRHRGGWLAGQELHAGSEHQQGHLCLQPHDQDRPMELPHAPLTDVTMNASKGSTTNHGWVSHQGCALRAADGLVSTPTNCNGALSTHPQHESKGKTPLSIHASLQDCLPHPKVEEIVLNPDPKPEATPSLIVPPDLMCHADVPGNVPVMQPTPVSVPDAGLCGRTDFSVDVSALLAFRFGDQPDVDNDALPEVDSAESGSVLMQLAVPNVQHGLHPHPRRLAVCPVSEEEWDPQSSAQHAPPPPVEDAQSIVSALQGCAPLRHLVPLELQQLVQAFTLESHCQGDFIFAHGDSAVMGNGLCMVRTGSCIEVLPTGETRQLSEGCIFGTDMVFSTSRTSTVHAASNLVDIFKLSGLRSPSPIARGV